jgi:drug/metabolite transporter (DMT)-like permease
MESAPPSTHPRRRAIGIALAVGGLLLMSVESPGLKLTRLGSWDNTLFLGAFSAISMFASVRVRSGEHLVTLARRQSRWLYVSSVIQAATTLFFVLALHHTTVANTMVIFATTPAIGALIAMIAIRERTPLRTWLGIAGAIAGISIVMSGSFGGGRLLGDLFALIAMIGYAANLTIWRRFRDMPREVVIGLGALGMALVALPLASFQGIDARALVILATLGLLTAPVARVMLASSTRYLPVSHVGLLTPVETVAATTLAFVLLNEVPPVTLFAGGALVLVSLLVGVTG